MRISRTSYVCLFLSLVLGMTSACQKSKMPAVAKPDQKSPDSLAACDDLNLTRDAAWTATFLRLFVLCASDQNQAKHQSLEHTLKLIDELGPERLQTAMDLMIANPKTLAPSEPSIYPNLNAFITLMDRGTHSESGLALAGTEHRWDTLQDSLAAFRPRPVLQFLMALEDAGALDSLVAELITWSDAMPKGSLAGLAHIVLTQSTIRQDVRQVQSVTIDDPVVYQRLKNFWAPLPEGEKTFSARAQDFWTNASIEQQKRWAHIGAAFLRMGLETQIDELLRRTHDLYNLLRSYALRQTHFFTDLHELLAQTLNTQLSALEPAMKGLNQIKDNPSYRDAFEEKAGSTYLHELVEDFMWEGGQLQSCSTNFAGMKSQPELTDPAAILRPLLTPQSACQGRVPLLLYLDETLGLNCRTGVCARPWMSKEADLSAAELQSLAQFAWNWLEKELQADPWRLKNRQLAYGPIEGDTLNQLKVWWEQHRPTSVEQLVQFDQELTTDPRFEALLKKDFLESWYGFVLQKLNTLPDEFRDIWPEQNNLEGWYQKSTDLKLQRAGLGLYAFGALDQAYTQALPIHDAFRSLDAALPNVIDPSNLSQILNPTREIASQIKNAKVSIKPETEIYSIEWAGSISSHLAFTPDGKVAKAVQPYAIDHLTSENAEGWVMASRYRDQLPLLTAAADPTRAKNLEGWVNDWYLPQWSTALKKTLGTNLESLPLDLFEGRALSSEEVRLFTLFAAQTWLGVQPHLPNGTKIASLPTTPAFTNERAPQAFLGLPVLAGSSQTWTAFWAFNNGAFASDKNSLQSLLQSLPRDAAAVKQEFLAAAQNPQILTQGRLNVIDRDKISAQTKLLAQLQAISSLYKSRGQQQIVPALGFDAFCANSQGVGECPFSVNNFTAWRRFLEERVLDQFCPFISGSQFSATFQNEWRSALGFHDNPEQLAQLCAGIPALAAGTIPSQVWEHNWLTLIRLGRNPQLKPSLQQLPETMRRLKIKEVSGAYQKFVRFNEMAPLWMSVANARLQHREGVYAAFRWHAPGMIDHVIAGYNHEIGDKVFTDALKKLGRLSGDGANPVFNLVNTVTDSYAASVAAQESMTAFVLRLGDVISKDPQLIQTTSRLLEKPEDPFAGILLAYTFPQAMKVGVFEDFAWDHPSYKLMRLAFKSENRRLLLGLVAAFDRLSPKLWKIYQDAASAYPDRGLMTQDAEQLLRFGVDNLALSDRQGRLSILWQDLLRKAVTDASFASFIRIVHQMREPLVDLNNTWQPSLMENLDSAVHSTITGSLRMMPWLEKLPNGTGFDLMVNAWRGLSGGLLHKDGNEVWALMQDKRLGLGDQGIIMVQMRDAGLRADVRKMLKGLWTLEADWLLAGLDEIEGLALSTQKVLHYFEKNVRWHGIGSASYQYFIKTLDHQLDNEHKHLQDQLNLLRSWVRPESETACKGGTITC